MTIIVAINGMMVADSGMSQGTIMRRVARPKIVRNDAGWLSAWAGSAGPGQIFERWFLTDMSEPKPPITDEDFCALFIAPDGEVWRVDCPLELYRMQTPAVCGEPSAEAFVLGAIFAGASPKRAIELACEHCAWAAGPVQVERVKVARAPIDYTRKPQSFAFDMSA